MARRHRNDEIAFGSDSFLDIVANIVGILIILMVIAGVRVSRMPPPSPDKSPSSSPSPPVVASVMPTKTPLTAETPPTEILSVVTTDSELPLLALHAEPVSPPEPPLPVEPPDELVAKVARLETDLERLASLKKGLAVTMLSTAESADELRQRVEVSRAALTKESLLVEEGRQVVVTLQTEVETHQREVAGLHLDLSEVIESAPPPQVIKHKLTPIGKVAVDDELHFLLSGNRIAVVPIAELADDLKAEIKRNWNQLVRGQTRIGQVGPVKGFVMEYVVERDTLSMIQELRMGRAMVRIGVSEWRLLPQADVITETADEALHPRSKFLGALRKAGPRTTLTFWVYPDSFALHRRLQEFAHDNGFDVAGRPLPKGIPITGSNRGSKSVVQ